MSRERSPINHFFHAFWATAAAIAIVVPAYAAEEKSRKDAEFDALKIKNADVERDRPAVTDTRDNISIDSSPDPNLLANTPDDCFAARIAEKSRTIEWRPKWRFEGVGGPRLPDAQLSPDGSVLAIAEIAGAANGPFSSRLALINACNYKCLRLIELPETKLSHFILLPQTEAALVAQGPQPEFKQEWKVFMLDLKTGRRLAETPAFGSRLTAMAVAADASKLLVKTAESTKIYVFDLSRMSQPLQTLETAFKGGALAMADDGTTLVAAGKGKVLFFNLDSSKSIPSDEKALPADFTPDQLVLCSRDGSLFVVAASGREILRSGADHVRVLAKNAGGALVYDRKNQRLIAETAVKSMLTFYALPKFEATGTCQPKTVQPATSGDIISLSPVSGGLLTLDSRGNLFLLHKPKSSWKKNLIFEAMK